MMLQKSSSGAIHCGAEMVRKNECLCSGPGKMANCNPNMFNWFRHKKDKKFSLYH